jgi:hypothetical protein
MLSGARAALKAMLVRSRTGKFTTPQELNISSAITPKVRKLRQPPDTRFHLLCTNIQAIGGLNLRQLLNPEPL